MKFRKNLFKLSLGFAILSLGFSSTAFAMESLPEKPSIESAPAGTAERADELFEIRFVDQFPLTKRSVDPILGRRNYTDIASLKREFRVVITQYFKKFAKNGGFASFDDVCNALNLTNAEKEDMLKFLAEAFKDYINSPTKSAHSDEARVIVFLHETPKDKWSVHAGFSPQLLVKKLKKEKGIELAPSDFKNICCKIKTKGKITKGKDKGKEIERVFEIPSSSGKLLKKIGETNGYDAFVLQTEGFALEEEMFLPDLKNYKVCEVELYDGSFDEKNFLCSLKGAVEKVDDDRNLTMFTNEFFNTLGKFYHTEYFDIIFWFKYYMTEILNKGDKLSKVLGNVSSKAESKEK